MCDAPPPEPGDPDGCFNIVANCGFEFGDFSPWARSGDLGYTDIDGTAVHTGVFGLDTGPVGGLGFIAQYLSTTAGQTYNLTFWLRNAQTENRFQVLWNGTLLWDYTNLDDFPYTQFEIDGLVATSFATELKFGFYNPPDFFWFDDVVVLMTGCAAPSARP